MNKLPAPLAWLLGACAATLLVFTALALLLPAPPGLAVDVHKERPFFSLPFGDDPFTPAELRTPDGKLVDWRGVPSARSCGECHRQEFMEWVTSVHAVSDEELIYATTVLENTEKTQAAAHHGTEKGRWCEACHNPLGVATGAVTPINSVPRTETMEEGVTCVVCHTASHAEPLAGNGALTIRLNDIFRHLHPALIMAAPARHATDMQARRDVPLMGDSALCGACHTEIRPTTVAGEEPMNLQETYDEWRRSPWAKQNVHCQDCHMAADPAATVAALKRGEKKPRGVSHRIVGNNYLLANPDLPGKLMTTLRAGSPTGMNKIFRRQEYENEQRTTNAQVIGLLRQAADLSLQTNAAGDAADNAANNAPQLSVTVTNSGAGHALPTGALDQRHMWLEVKVRAADGKVHFHSGAFDAAQGRTDPAAVSWVKEITDVHGKLDLRHQLFDADRLYYPRKPIPAGVGDRVDYALPALPPGRYQVEATLWYRLAFQEILDNFAGQTGSKPDVIIPPLDIATATGELTVGLRTAKAAR